MKITLEVGEDALKFIEKQVGSSDVKAVAAFAQTAVANELRRFQDESRSNDAETLAAMAFEIEKLRQGQRALFLLVDRASTVMTKKRHCG